MAKPQIKAIDISVVVLSLLTYVLDVGTDLLVCAQLLTTAPLWGWLVAGTVAIPGLLMTVFSIVWHVHDGTCSPATLALHLTLLAPLERYVRSIYLCFKAQVSHKLVHVQRAVRASSDICVLRLCQAFLGAAPQCVLQAYLMVKEEGRPSWLLGLSCSCSLVSMAWSVTAYTYAQRRARKSDSAPVSPPSWLLVHAAWQLCMALSRLAALVACCLVLGAWTASIVGAHWLISFLSISLRGTDYGSSPCERWMFRVVCSYIYVFVFLNVNNGTARWRVTTYYIFVFLENVAMLAVFVLLGGNNTLNSGYRIQVSVLMCCLVLGGFIIGLVCMLVYYGVLHPSGSKLKSFLFSKGKDISYATSPTSSGPQIFSIESPLGLPSGSGINLSVHTNSSTLHTQHTWLTDPDPKNGSYPTSSQQIESTWTSDLASSSSASSSSSSLNSAGLMLAPQKQVKMTLEKDLPVDSASNPSSCIQRKYSVVSGSSGDSASSELQLLPPSQPPSHRKSNNKNNKSNSARSPRKTKMGSNQQISSDTSHSSQTSQISGRVGDSSGSDNNTVFSSNMSELSRNSWARSSDAHHGSMPVEFTVLGFDDTSLDQRPSDTSSLAYSSRPRSLSPINVQDAHGRLRATIAATIAAATTNSNSNSSSSESASPSKSRSISHRSQASLVSANSLSLKHRSGSTSSQVHDNAFLDSGSSYRDSLDRAAGDSQVDSHLFSSSSQASATSRIREGLSSLPDIVSSLEQDQMSDLDSLGQSHSLSQNSSQNHSQSRVQSRRQVAQRSGGEALWQSPGSLSPSDLSSVSRASERQDILSCSLSLVEDSTLTVSKLDNLMHKPISYLKATKRRRQSLPTQQSSSSKPHPNVNPKTILKAQPAEPKLITNFTTPHIFQNDNPQPVDLTIHKQMVSNQSSPSHSKHSPFSDRELVTVMNRSLQSYIASSATSSKDSFNPEREGLALTLDDLRFSRETTPNRSGSTVKSGELQRCPSASSLFHDSFESSPVSSASKMNREKANDTNISPNALKLIDLTTQNSIVSSFGPEAKALAAKSSALKFIMDSYGRIKLSPTGSLTSPSSICQKNPQSNSPDVLSHSTRSAHTPPSVFLDICKGSFPHQNRRHSYSYNSSTLQLNHLDDNSLTNSSNRNTTNGKLQVHHLTKSPLSVHRRSSLNIASNFHDVTSQDENVRPRVGHSATKKLNISQKDNFILLEYSNSPQKRQPKNINLKDVESRSESGLYVAGEYHPPLCPEGKSDSENDSIDRNLDKSRNSLSLGKKDRKIFDKALDLKQSIGDPDPSEIAYINSIRSELMKRDFINHKSFKSKQGQSFNNPVSSLQPLQNTSIPVQDHNSHNLQPSHQLTQMTEDELHVSAQKVANYFTEVLDEQDQKSDLDSYMPHNLQKQDTGHKHNMLSSSQNICSKVPLNQQKKATRQPLKPLTNTPLNISSTHHIASSDVTGGGHLTVEDHGTVELSASPIIMLPTQKIYPRKGLVSRNITAKKVTTRPPPHQGPIDKLPVGHSLARCVGNKQGQFITSGEYLFHTQ